MSSAHSRLRLVAVALLTLAAACSDASTAPRPADVQADRASPKLMLGMDAGGEPRRELTTDVYDLSGSLVQLPCGEDGYTEEIEMQGQIFASYALVRDAAGGLHVTAQWMPVGMRGVGVTSGAEYRVAEREHIAFNGNQMNALGIFRHTIDFHAPAIGVRGSWVVTGRWVTNANGEVVMERQGIHAECRA